MLLRRVPDAFSSTYPGVKIVRGNYDDVETIKSNAAVADIVIHNGDSDHEPSLKAILSGLLERSTPGYLLHLSGTGIVSDWMDEQYLGKTNPKIWSDVSSIEEIRNVSPRALHRNTEIILHDTVQKHSDKVNIAVMCPPDIYGKGKGLAKTHSALVPMYIQEVRNLEGKVFYYNEGGNVHSWVHIDDLMGLYLKVVEAAASGKGKECFNDNGYYFAATQEHAFIEVARVIGKTMHKEGAVEDPEPVPISLEEVNKMLRVPGYEKLAQYMFTSNSRTRPERAEKLFGYKGEGPGLLESLESEVVDFVRMP